MSVSPSESAPRSMPQNVEAERSVLGGVLLTNSALDELLDVVQPGDFYRAGHQRIYEAMLALGAKSEPIDTVTLAEALRSAGHIEVAGGEAYLQSLDSAVPATANLGHYAKIVAEKASVRRVIEAANRIARTGYEQRGDVQEYLDTVESTIFAVTEAREANSFKDIQGVVRNVFKGIETLYERNTEITGIGTGLAALDGITAGLQRGDLILVGGRPSMGKTAFAMGVAEHVGIVLKQPVAVFSMEMSAESLTTRLFSSLARVDGQRLRTGKLLDSDWAKLARAADALFYSPICIDDTPGQTVLQLRSKARRLAATKGELGLVVVDYVQLMTGSPTADNREQQIAEISRGLKALAREMKVPVIALSQLNRSLERRDDKRPVLSDLRESGSLEQDADVIVFVYRDEVYNKESSDKGIAELIIGKQRNGPIGTVRTLFQRDYTRFETHPDDRCLTTEAA
jgi:replicative DNA helicase